MSKLSRQTLLQFGSTGSSGNFGEIGSNADASGGVYTKDIQTIQSLSAYLAGLQSVVIGTSGELCLEDLNSLFFLQGYMLSYLMQEGIAEYDASTTYYTNSIVKYSGVLYTSLADSNVGNTPSSSSVYWSAINTSGAKTGFVYDFAGSASSIPSGYLLCDGSAVSRTTYAALFAAIGTTWGTGNGSTTFNLPDLSGKVAVGYSASDSTFGTVGNTGGEKTHTLTIAEMPSHRHELYASYDDGTGDGGAADTIRPWRDSAPSINLNSGSPYNSMQETGGSSAHNNLQPYGVLLKIIKV